MSELIQEVPILIRAPDAEVGSTNEKGANQWPAPILDQVLVALVYGGDVAATGLTDHGHVGVARLADRHHVAGAVLHGG